jgi:hypothetical protein
MRAASAFFILCGFATPAVAQLDLPGATAPAPVGTVTKPEPARAKRTSAPTAHAVAPSSPAEATLAGKTLALNGGRSQITLSPHDKTVEVSRLLLHGTKVSNGRDECEVDVSGMPLTLAPLGKSDGLSRFSLAVPNCPVDVTVLDSAILTSVAEGACTFKEADCRVGVSGLWGPAAGAIGPNEVKTIERERTGAERSVRTAYKGLVSSTKDRATIRTYASDQAGFSSYREEHCRDYIGETRHGFCASRLTQARALTLEAELVVAEAAKDARKKKRAERAGRR